MRCRTKMSSTAPMVATIMAPSKPPPKDMPRELNRNPPSKAPSTPTIMSPMTPKPPPPISCPASHPATNPTNMNQMNAIMRSSYKSVNFKVKMYQNTRQKIGKNQGEKCTTSPYE